MTVEHNEVEVDLRPQSSNNHNKSSLPILFYLFIFFKVKHCLGLCIKIQYHIAYYYYHIYLFTEVATGFLRSMYGLP